MNAAELDALLRQFLVDHKLSDAERKVLGGWVRTNVTTDQQRGVARSRVFAAARNAAADPTSTLVIDFLEDAMKVLAPLTATAGPSPDEAFFSPGEACLGRIIARLTNARKSADLCVFTITDDRISSAILAAHKRGVAVRIITDNDKAYDPGSDVPRFRAAGIPLKVDETPFHMHHKFALFDGGRLLNGSYNWTRSAADQNQENVVDTGDPQVVAAFQKEFDTLWQRLS